MTETQQSIAQWANNAFGPAARVERIAARANEEMAELLRAATVEPCELEAVAMEAADVVIVLYRLAHVCGFDLNDLINHKMTINRAREWKLDGTGHGYHVRDRSA
ncbi:MAG: nucleotide pyrophosphohydrolase [Gammaproteobacteria bacterium]